MPATGNIYQTYDFGFGHDLVNREDLLDIVVNIAPWETPLFSTMAKTTARHTTHDWIEDTLATASGAGSFEGRDFSGGALLTRSRLSNWTQIFDKHIVVSNTQRAVDPAGVADEYSYQIQIGLKEIARNIETRLFATASGITGDAGTNARLFKNLNDMITSNTASATAGSGHGKANLDSLMERTFIAGGVPDSLFVHPSSKTKLADNLNTSAQNINYRNIAAAAGTIDGNIDVYRSNFGPIKIIPDRFIPTASATASVAPFGGRLWLLEMPKIRMAFLRPIRHIPLPPNGDHTRGIIVGEMTPEIMANAAHGKVINVLTN